MSNNLAIIAAGNNTRMNLGIPKPLVKINGKENIVWLLENSYNYYDNIFIVIKHGEFYRYKYLESKFVNKLNFIEINSGKGDAHAILKFLESVINTNISIDDKLTIIWGDTFCPNDTIFKIINNCEVDNFIHVPLLLENNPYVYFTLDNCSFVTSAKFNKENEVKFGYHDQCIFYSKVGTFYSTINHYNILKYKESSSTYNTSNNELKLINMLNDFKYICKGLILKEDLGIRSFNNIQDLKKINYEI